MIVALGLSSHCKLRQPAAMQQPLSALPPTEHHRDSQAGSLAQCARTGAAAGEPRAHWPGGRSANHRSERLRELAAGKAAAPPVASRLTASPRIPRDVQQPRSPRRLAGAAAKACRQRRIVRSDRPRSSRSPHAAHVRTLPRSLRRVKRKQPRQRLPTGSVATVASPCDAAARLATAPAVPNKCPSTGNAPNRKWQHCGRRSRRPRTRLRSRRLAQRRCRNAAPWPPPRQRRCVWPVCAVRATSGGACTPLQPAPASRHHNHTAAPPGRGPRTTPHSPPRPLHRRQLRSAAWPLWAPADALRHRAACHDEARRDGRASSFGSWARTPHKAERAQAATSVAGADVVARSASAEPPSLRIAARLARHRRGSDLAGPRRTSTYRIGYGLAPPSSRMAPLPGRCRRRRCGPNATGWAAWWRPSRGVRRRPRCLLASPAKQRPLRRARCRRRRLPLRIDRAADIGHSQRLAGAQRGSNVALAAAVATALTVAASGRRRLPAAPACCRFAQSALLARRCAAHRRGM